MAKNIKLQAYVNTEIFNKVMFSVLEQSNTGYYFGAAGYATFRATNGIILSSGKYPANDKVNKNVIWLRGREISKDNNTVVVGKTRWAKIVQAVKEYNEYFADRAPAPRPAPANCAVIIG